MHWKQKWQKWLPWLGVLLITAVAIHPLLGPPPAGDDLRLHFYRIPIVADLWQNGVFFSRWIPSLNFGYGSPLFNFYPPLSAYALTAVYHLSGQNAPVAFNLLFALAITISAVGMFFLGRHLYGPAGGLLAAAAYAWSPHLLHQTYGRSSSSNALALAFFPWATWAFIRLAQRPSLFHLLIAALCLAATMLSHTAASLLFIPLLLVMGLTAVYHPQHNRSQLIRRMGVVLAALLLGLGLTAFSWLPAFSEIQVTRYAAEASQVNIGEYFSNAWQWPARAIPNLVNPGLPITPGLAQIALGITGTAAALITLWRWRKHPRPSTFSSPNLLTAVGGIMGLAALFMAVPLSTPIWEIITPLQNLQFPWRLLDIPTFFLALAAGRLLMGRLRVSNLQSPISNLLAFIGVLIMFANIIPYLYPARTYNLPQRPTLANVTAVQQQFGIWGLTGWGEYSSAAVQTWPQAPPFAGADSDATLMSKINSDLPPISSTPWQAAWVNNSAVPQTITVQTHYFPGWQATVDGRPVPITTDDDGRIQFNIPAGEHQVELAFGNTSIRRLANGITLLAAVVTFLFVVRALARLKRAKARTTNDETSFIPLVLVALFGLLLMVKLLWLDRFTNPLVAHLQDGRIPGISAPDNGRFPDHIQLLGYDLTPPDQLDLYWQVDAVPTTRHTIAVTLSDAAGVPVKIIYNDIPGYTPTTAWEPGQIIHDEYTLPLNLLKAPIGYIVSVSLDEAANMPVLSAAEVTVTLGRTKRAPSDTAVPPIAQPIGTIFGEAIRLSHTDIPQTIQAGKPFDFTFYWESLAPVAKDYTIFIHLLHPDGSLAAGQDGQPLNGRYPTSYWEPDEKIADTHTWQPDLPPGNYQLQIGLYQLQTGQRLPLSGPQSHLGDRLILSNIEIH
ncbi:MAG: hypothetical protein GY796_05340 [Chloroflexi bacterium]|nr:hypothetical protein [Chloroflexota bacterium]